MSEMMSQDMAQDIAEEINALRRNPRQYAEELAELQRCFKGTLLTFPGTGRELETIEGIAALKDCVQDLLQTTPLPELQLSQALCRSCADHVTDLQVHGFCSHIGTDGSTPEARLARVGRHREQCGENAIFGASCAKEAVIQMLLDDGSVDRGHRANLLNPDFHHLGVAHGRHPSCATATILLLVDEFHPTEVSRPELMRRVAETKLGPVADTEGVSRDATSYKAWDRLMQDVKPAHLAVPKDVLDVVQRMDKPKVYSIQKKMVPRVPLGSLIPKPGIDPAMVRAFVHRLDVNHDDLIEEHEIVGLCHQKQLDLSPQDVKQLFDEILERRHRSERNRRAVDWTEVFAELRAHKRWVPVVDLHVELDSERYQLVAELEALVQWCREVRAECAGLPDPPATGSTTDHSRNGSIVRDLNSFLASVLSARVPSSGHLLQEQPKVQRLLARTGGAISVIRSAVCMSRRQLWAYHVRPSREAWLALIKAAGLEPQVRTAIVGNRRATEESMLNMVQPVTSSGPTLTTGSRKMAVHDPPTRVHVRSGDSALTAQPTSSLGSPTSLASPHANRPVPPWEEKRQQCEMVVNQAIMAGGALSPDEAHDGARAEPVAYTFGAQRRFLQVSAQQQQASGERRLGAALRLPATGTGSAADLLGTMTGIGTSTPSSRREKAASASPASRGRGAGAYSVLAPGGVRGHFHNSNVLHSKSNDHSWPQSLEVRWEGVHLDQTKAPPVREEVRLSTMSRKERDRQFSCYFGKAQTSCFEAKMMTAAEQADWKEKYQDWQPYASRPDAPLRHGKHGRRAFDPQVGERPLANPCRISEIDTQPMEARRHQQDRMDEILDRALPPKQYRPFQPYLPQSSMPGKAYEFASGAPFIQDLNKDWVAKRTDLGYGQVRHSDKADMRLYTRPLGSSQLDRVLPLA